MMRLFRSGAALFATLLVLIGGTRWLAQRSARGPVFPLPQADACWIDLCPLDQSVEDFVTALEGHPDVVPGTVHTLDSGDYGQVVVQFAYLGGAYWKMLVGLDGRSYTLAADRPLLSLGDVLITLGAPQRITFTARLALLHYPGLDVSVEPAPHYWRWLHLDPHDPVIRLQVVRANSGAPVYDRDAVHWRGLGVYWVAGSY